MSLCKFPAGPSAAAVLSDATNVSLHPTPCPPAAVGHSKQGEQVCRGGCCEGAQPRSWGRAGVSSPRAVGATNRAGKVKSAQPCAVVSVCLT